MKCVCGREVQVLRSGAGWYIGTADEEGPYCRCSVEYYRTEAEAEQELAQMCFTERKASETLWCNGNRGCFGTPQEEDEDDEEEEYFIIDLDMGFDPYMGCYSDDC